MAQPIEAVVFDMDGVLIDSEPLWREVEREVFGDLGIEVTDADLDQTMGVRINEVVALWRSHQPWDEPSSEEVERRIVDGVARFIRERGAGLPRTRSRTSRTSGCGWPWPRRRPPC